MTTTQNRTERPAPAPGRRSSDLARAWIGIAVVPVFFVLAFAAGEGTSAALGYPDGNGPAWADLVSAVVATVVVLLPCLAAIWFGRRAYLAGAAGRPADRRGLVPAVLGAVLGLGALVLTVVTEVNDLLLH